METKSNKALNDEKKNPLTHNENNIESTESRPPMATIEDDDERLLARIGYRQVSPASRSNT
jgi:hypothetical protein